MTTANNDIEYWVGFDLGGTKIQATVFDGKFRPIGRRRRRTRGQDGVDSGLHRILETIQGALDDAKVGAGQVSGIGVGCAGPLDLERGVIREASNLGWENVPIKTFLESQLGCPAHIANDVDLGVYGEYSVGAAQGARCVFGVFLGTGIGGGCVYDGRIFRGKSMSCMEIGHTPVERHGPLCSCGQRGCLESVASRLAIAAAAVQAAYRGQAPHLHQSVGTDLSKIRSSDLAAAIVAGDTVIEQLVTQSANYIGTALGGVIHLLAPDVVVLGGGLVEAMPELYLRVVDRTAKDWVLPSFKESFRTVVAQLGDDAVVMGAATWARQQTVLPTQS